MYDLIVRTHFAAAHKLRGYEGDCEHLHGHNWRIEVQVHREQLDELGMVCDFHEVKRLIKEATDGLDHHYLNEHPPFDKVNPTSENIARFLFDKLAEMLPEGVLPKSVTAWESDNCGVCYHGQ